MQSPSESRWQDLQQLRVPDRQQLDRIEAYLDLVLLALVAIAKLNSETLLQAAEELNLTAIVGEHLSRWRSGMANKSLDVEEARSLVLIICHIAERERELIRRAVSLLEQIEAEHREPESVTLLKDYLNKFINLYRSQTEERSPVTFDLSKLAWKLLTDLLFYSGSNGHRLLWLATLDAAS
ncbi:DUF3038 domain-containing protein [Myxosarcina sp. GI1(2024)]